MRRRRISLAASSTSSSRPAILSMRSPCIEEAMYTRREFGLLTLSSLALPALGHAQTINGVRLGVQTYSLRELPRPAGGDMVEPLITGMAECGFTECELWAPQIEPVSPFGR